MGYALACLISTQTTMGSVPTEKGTGVAQEYRKPTLEAIATTTQQQPDLDSSDFQRILLTARAALLERKMPVAEPSKWNDVSYGYIRLDELRERIRTPIGEIQVIEGPLTLTREPIQPPTIALYVVTSDDAPAVQQRIGELRAHAKLVERYHTQAAFLYFPHNSEERTIAEVQHELYDVLREDAAFEARSRGADTIAIDPTSMEFDIQKLHMDFRMDDGRAGVIPLRIFLFGTTWELFKCPPAAESKP